jgi:hypothetical protein
MLEFLLNLSLHAAAPDLLEGGLGGLWNAIATDLGNLDQASAWIAFGQVLMIDIMLAGDNAIVVGALAAGLPADQRKKVILIGIIAALVLRIIFASGRHAVDADRRPDLRGRPAPALGELEDVS